MAENLFTEYPGENIPKTVVYCPVFLNTAPIIQAVAKLKKHKLVHNVDWNKLHKYWISNDEIRFKDFAVLFAPRRRIEQSVKNQRSNSQFDLHMLPVARYNPGFILVDISRVNEPGNENPLFARSCEEGKGEQNLSWYGLVEILKYLGKTCEIRIWADQAPLGQFVKEKLKNALGTDHGSSEHDGIRMEGEGVPNNITDDRGGSGFGNCSEINVYAYSAHGLQVAKAMARQIKGPRDRLIWVRLDGGKSYKNGGEDRDMELSVIVMKNKYNRHDRARLFRYKYCEQGNLWPYEVIFEDGDDEVSCKQVIDIERVDECGSVRKEMNAVRLFCDEVADLAGRSPCQFLRGEFLQPAKEILESWANTSVPAIQIFRDDLAYAEILAEHFGKIGDGNERK